MSAHAGALCWFVVGFYLGILTTYLSDGIRAKVSKQ